MISSSSAAQRLADEVVVAHGGLDVWRGAAAIEVDLSSGGPAFAVKGRSSALREVTARVATSGQDVELHGATPTPWSFRFADAQALSRGLGALRRRGHRLRWSSADVAAFAAAAMWTYTSLPFVLLGPGMEVELLAPARDGARRLRVRFPPKIATHSPVQVLHVDDAGVIRRHDYTALAFGRWAVASQRLTDHRWFDGLLVPTRRRVTPRLLGRPAPGPTLVWIDVRDVRVLRSVGAG